MDYTLQDHERALAKAQAAGDTAAVSEITKSIQGVHAKAYSKASDAGDVDAAEHIAGDYRKTRTDWSRDTANTDPLWIDNAKTLYKEAEKKDFKGSDNEASTWLKGYMSDFNYRLLGSEKLGLRNTIGIGTDVAGFSPKGKAAFLTSMDDFDQLPYMSLEGAGAFAGRAITDPTNLVGIGTGGAAAAEGQAAKIAAKQGLKQLIKAGLKKTAITAGIGAIDGGFQGGVSDLATQNAEINAGRGEEFDLARAGKAAGTGAVVGGALGVAGAEVGNLVDSAKNKITALGSDKLKRGKDLAAMEAETVQSLKAARDNPTNTTGMVSVRQANAVSKRPLTDALNLSERSSLPKEVKKRIRDLTDESNSRVLGPDDLDSISDTPEGKAVASAIQKYQVSDSATSRFQADSTTRKAARTVLDIAPLPRIITEPIRNRLKPLTREDLINERVLSKEGTKVAENVLSRTGPSSATTGRTVLEDSVATQSATEAAQRAQKAQAILQRGSQRTQEKADNAAVRATERAQRAQAMLQRGSQRAQERSDRAAVRATERGQSSQAMIQRGSQRLEERQARQAARQQPRPGTAPRAPRPSPQPTNPSGNIPPGNGSGIVESARAGTQVRDFVLHANARREIQGMENDVIGHAKTLPEGGKLRTALETYVQSLRTDAKNDPAARDRLHAVLSSKLSGEDAKAFAEQTEKLRKRFQKVTAEDAADAVEKAN
jgi:hypothetical protein